MDCLMIMGCVLKWSSWQADAEGQTTPMHFSIPSYNLDSFYLIITKNVGLK